MPTAPVAQWIERIGSNDRVERSTRSGGTLIEIDTEGGISSMAERYPVEVDVAGSNPVYHP